MSSQSRAVAPDEAARVLDFWIGDADEDVEAARARSSMWFGGSTEVDREIETRFADTVSRVKAGECDHWIESPEGALASIIVLDQFSRNLFRGTPEAFESDARSLSLCLGLLESGRIEQLGPVGKVFALMPMQHAEDIEIQQRSVAEFERLAANCKSAHHDLLLGNANYARVHRDIVARFGRFPHRNRILGRQSTAEETTWLEQGAPTFGQGG